MVNLDYAQKMKRCHVYLEALEEEQRKIQVFQRELPLCLELVTQAIDACRKELSGSPTTTEYAHGGQSECSEQTLGDGPILEEFIPIKRSSSSDEEEQESHEPENNCNEKIRDKNGDKKKSDWLRSVQLWNNQSPDLPSKEDEVKDAAVVEVRKNGGAFHPFHREKNDEKNSVPTVGKPTASVPASTTSSTTENETKLKNANLKKEKEDKEAQNRKQRRCWSAELHRRFLQALQQLGGSHVATPKQIRELMKVDGLTNDEVKSHLQKYRLHTRRPAQSSHNNGNQQAPQFVVVGGIWVPPPEYATISVTTAAGDTASVPASRIYTPVPAKPQASRKPVAKRPQQYEERGGHSEGGTVHSYSPAASSSSTHTTTTSPTSS